MILILFSFAKKTIYFQEILELFSLSFEAFLLREKIRKRLSKEFPRPKNTSMGVFKHQEITYGRRLEISFYKKNGKSYREITAFVGCSKSLVFLHVKNIMFPAL